MLNCCVMHSYISPPPGIMVWSGIIVHCRTSLAFIAGRLDRQCYVLKSVVLSYIQRSPSVIFQQDNLQTERACNGVEFVFIHQIESPSTGPA
ncbi:hypothetical protein TNCV_984431 [Trichonephila clavipes]|nr:hypothetical protein TNCV_984431 [Trichonephila clavipes]